MAWSEDQPMVSIKDLHKSFGDLEVLKDRIAVGEDDRGTERIEVTQHLE